MIQRKLFFTLIIDVDRKGINNTFEVEHLKRTNNFIAYYLIINVYETLGLICLVV